MFGMISSFFFSSVPSDAGLSSDDDEKCLIGMVVMERCAAGNNCRLWRHDDALLSPFVYGSRLNLVQIRFVLFKFTRITLFTCAMFNFCTFHLLFFFQLSNSIVYLTDCDVFEQLDGVRVLGAWHGRNVSARKTMLILFGYYINML